MNKNINDDALLVHLTISQMKRILESVFQQQSLSTVSNQPETINIEDVSKMTGYKKATIYKLIHERKIPCHKPANGGRKVFFKTKEINQWLQSNRIETNEEFFQKYEGNNKNKTNNTLNLQQLIRLLKFSRQLFICISSVIDNYRSKIQELEEKVDMYEKNNQIIENLFIDNIKRKWKQKIKRNNLIE